MTLVKFKMDKLNMYGALEVDDWIETLNTLELEMEEEKVKKLKGLMKEIAWKISVLTVED